jgi:hypothetical protein
MQSQIGSSWFKLKAEIHIDHELITVIYQLNADGFITHSCCAGHDGDDGYITFYGEYSDADIHEILRPYSLKVKSIEIIDEERMKQHDDLWEEHREFFGPDAIAHITNTMIHFEGIGQSRVKKRARAKQ